MSTLSRDEFAERLAASGLLSAAAIGEFVASLPQDAAVLDGEQLAELLVERELLTAYQAQHILAGKGASLVMGNYILLDTLGQAISTPSSSRDISRLQSRFQSM